MARHCTPPGGRCVSREVLLDLTLAVAIYRSCSISCDIDIGDLLRHNRPGGEETPDFFTSCTKERVLVWCGMPAKLPCAATTVLAAAPANSNRSASRLTAHPVRRLSGMLLSALG